MGVRFFSAVLFFLGVFSLIEASVRFPARGFDKVLSEESAQKRLSKYRSFILQESNVSRFHEAYSMKFSLRHMPRRGDEITRIGIMYGPFLGSGLLRLHIDSEIQKNDSQNLLFENGKTPKFWIKDRVNSKVERMNLTNSLEPLIQGMNQTAFDLLMPFVFWEGEYDSSGKVAGRPAHLFSFACPNWVTEIKPDWFRVTLALDDAYDAPLRVEVLGKSQIPERTLILRSFKKLGDRWIVKEIDCRDRKTRSVTRMKIISAALGLDINKTSFEPTGLDEIIKLDPKLYITTD